MLKQNRKSERTTSIEYGITQFLYDITQRLEYTVYAVGVLYKLIAEIRPFLFSMYDHCANPFTRIVFVNRFSEIAISMKEMLKRKEKRGQTCERT